MRLSTLLLSGMLSAGLSLSALADDHMGTAEEAKAMAERAAEALEADKDQALADFNAGAEGFMEKDLYVFCGDEETGEFTAHGANNDLIGVSMRDLKDKAGMAVGEKFYETQEGEINEVTYMWPRPGEEEPTEKSSYLIKAAGQICGVGYYAS